MSFGRFLKDKMGVFMLWIGCFLLTCLVLWLTPSVRFNLAAVRYLAILQLILFLFYLGVSYNKKLTWWKTLETRQKDQEYFTSYLEIGNTEEQKFIEDYLNNSIDEQRQRIDEATLTQQEQKDFIDSWVHEIKVPLASLKLINETIEDDISEKTYFQLENNLQKIESYVDQVLYYSRLDSFSKDYLIQECSLKKIIQPIIRQNANYFIQHNLHYAIEGEDYEVLTDQKWLGFILSQIIGNAIKYTPDNGRITLILSKNTQGVLLKITDSGIGIPLEDQRRIFDKGFTGNNGRNQLQHSTGLGLYLAKNLAEKLGHQISVSSEVNQGTTLYLFFPYLSYYTNEGEEKII